VLRDPDKRAAYDHWDETTGQVSNSGRRPIGRSASVTPAASGFRSQRFQRFFLQPIRRCGRRSAARGGRGLPGCHRGRGLCRHETPRHAQRGWPLALRRRANPAGVSEGQSLRIAGTGGNASLIFPHPTAPACLYVPQGRDVQIELPLARGRPPWVRRWLCLRWRDRRIDGACRRPIRAETSLRGRGFPALPGATKSSASSWSHPWRVPTGKSSLRADEKGIQFRSAGRLADALRLAAGAGLADLKVDSRLEEWSAGPQHTRRKTTKLQGHDDRNTAADQRVPSRNQASIAIGDPLDVFAQGNFPARTDFQRLGRLREAALRGARQARSIGADSLSVGLCRMPRPAPCPSRTMASA